jgi:hypothetical protein
VFRQRAAAHLTKCATGGRLRWLSLVSCRWLPGCTVAEVLAAHPSLEVVEVGANAANKSVRESTVWRFDARHLVDCLATRTGHRMARPSDPRHSPVERERTRCRRQVASRRLAFFSSPLVWSCCLGLSSPSPPPPPYFCTSHLFFLLLPSAADRGGKTECTQMFTKLPAAIAAQCVALLPLADHGALTRTSRYLGRVVMLPNVVIRAATYSGGLDAATGLLPAGLRRLPLHRLDVRDASVTVEPLVAQRETGGDVDDDVGDVGADGKEMFAKKAKLGLESSSVAATAAATDLPTEAHKAAAAPIAWLGTLRDLTVTAGQLVDTALLDGRRSSPWGALQTVVDTVDAIHDDCLYGLERLDTLRIVRPTRRDSREKHFDQRVATLCLGRMMGRSNGGGGGGIAGIATLRRLEIHGLTPRNGLASGDFSPLSALPQLEVLLIRDSHVSSGSGMLPWPMPNLRALALHRSVPPPWPAYPALEQLACASSGRLSPTLSAHLGACATASNAALQGAADSGGCRSRATRGCPRACWRNFWRHTRQNSGWSRLA